MVSHPRPKGATSQPSPIWGFLPIYAYTPSQNYHFWRGNTCRGGACILGQPSLPSLESGVSAVPDYGVLLYFACNLLTQNDQIQRGNTWGAARFQEVNHAQMSRAVCQR